MPREYNNQYVLDFFFFFQDKTQNEIFTSHYFKCLLMKIFEAVSVIV